MNEIKIEIDDDYLRNDTSCFICFQLVSSSFKTEEQLNLTNLFFKYLKIGDKVKAFVCAKCEENLGKFLKLCSTLEKVRMEMDFLLDSIKEVILNSNNSKLANSEIASARKLVVKKCLAEIKIRRSQIILERLDISGIKRKHQTATSSCHYDLPSFDNYFNSTSSDRDAEENVTYEKTSLPTHINENRRPQIILERLDLSKLIKKESQTPTSNCSDDWLPNLDNISNSSYYAADEKSNSTTIITNHTTDVKPEADLDKRANTFKPQKNNDVRPKVKCTKCFKIFCHKRALKLHINSIHLRIRPYKCDICEKSFATFCKLQTHKLRPHKLQPNSKLFSCKHCAKTFGSIQYLKNHEGYVHSEKRFPCNICKNKFKRQTDLRRHISAVHVKQRHYCQVLDCDKSYSRPLELNDHYKLKHPGFTIPPKQSNTVNSLEMTETGEAPSSFYNIPPTWEADWNSRASGDAIDEVPAIPLVKEIRNMKFDINSEAFLNNKENDFTNRKGAKDVLNPKPQIPNSKPFSCEICNKGFDTLKTLRRHKRCVHPKRVFPCNICEQISKSRTQLLKHISSKHEKQMYYCQAPGCNMRYSYKPSLVNHYRKDHPAFKVVQNLDSHSEKFTLIKDNGIEVVECLICREHFKTVEIFKNHFSKAHISVQAKFKCKYCGYTSQFKAVVNKHITQVHEAPVLLEKDNEGKATIVKVERNAILIGRDD